MEENTLLFDLLSRWWHLLEVSQIPHILKRHHCSLLERLSPRCSFVRRDYLRSCVTSLPRLTDNTALWRSAALPHRPLFVKAQTPKHKSGEDTDRDPIRAIAWWKFTRWGIPRNSSTCSFHLLVFNQLIWSPALCGQLAGFLMQKNRVTAL